VNAKKYFINIILFLFFFGYSTPYVFGQPRTLRVGADNAYFPFEYLDDERNPAGFDIDLLKALALEANLDIQITTGDWFIIKDQMKRGDFDMLAGMYYNPDRAEYYDFSLPYIIITHSLFVKSGSKIVSLTELKEDESIRVVVENSSILHKYLTTNGVLPERILAVENQLDALLIVEDSYTTCALLPALQAKYIAKKNGLDDIKMVGLPILPREYAFAVSKGDSVLLNRINTGLTQMHRNGKYKEIFENWFGLYNPTYSVLEEGYSIFWLVTLFLTVILVFVYFFMQFRLKKIIKENKTLNNELKQTNIVLKEIHKSETLLKRIIEFSPFPIAMIHEEGYFVFTNSGFEYLFGKQPTKSGSVNRWLSMAIKSEQEQSFIKGQFFYNPKDIISQGASHSTFTLTTKTNHEILMQLFFISLGNGQLLIFFSDNANNSENSKSSDFVEKKKKVTKSIFLPHFSHDVRSPMNIIMGFSSLIRTDDLTVAEMKSYAGLIHQNAQKLLYLLSNLGTLSKIESSELPIKLEFIIVSEFTNSVFNQFKGINSTEHKISCSEDTKKNLVVNADREILMQAVLNLLFYVDNLSKDEPLTLGCELTDQTKASFFIKTNLEEDIYKSLLLKIDAFQSNPSDPNHFFKSGTDLSLYVSLVLIGLFGSKANLSRDENNGESTCTFSLPNFSNDNPVAQYKVKSTLKKKEQFDWAGKRILIADDNLQSLAYFELIFKSTNAEIITAQDGREAYELCRKEAKIDLVLMDWLMPIMDGETSTKLIKQLEPRLPIIAVTAFALGDERTRILQSGCNAYYPKPVDRDDLLNYINTVFESNL
jgi:ABC-type amino acid transport substrate-binding protein/ActR/RegA family two-component response regulator